MGALTSRQNAGVEEADVVSNHAYKYPPRSGKWGFPNSIMYFYLLWCRVQCARSILIVYFYCLIYTVYLSKANTWISMYANIGL